MSVENKGSVKFANGNFKLTEEQIASQMKELETYQSQFIVHFNQGDYNYCADQYLEDAVMFARPVGTYRGREEIRAFWKKVIEDGVSEFTQWDTVANMCSDKRAVVCAQWEMNKFGGTIFSEEWCRMDDGSWKLLSDHFEIAFHKNPDGTRK